MKIFRSISAVLLAILVLVSSTSFIVAAHFCMGEMENIAFFSKAAGCEKEQSLPPCHKHMKPACCDDEVVFHDGSDFKGSVEGIDIPTLLPSIIEAPVVVVAEVIPDSHLARIWHYNYDPPLRSCDLTVDHQVFRI